MDKIILDLLECTENDFESKQYIFKDQMFLNELSKYSKIDILKLINLINIREITSSNIPQYSNYKKGTYDLIKILRFTDNIGLGYERLGEYLLQEDGKIRKSEANYKYGENHAKLSYLHGLVSLSKDDSKTKVYLTDLGEQLSFLDIDKFNNYITFLSLRIPIIQVCIKNNITTRKEITNLLTRYLAESTAKRRTSNIFNIIYNFKEVF